MDTSKICGTTDSFTFRCIKWKTEPYIQLKTSPWWNLLCVHLRPLAAACCCVWACPCWPCCCRTSGCLSTSLEMSQQGGHLKSKVTYILTLSLYKLVGLWPKDAKMNSTSSIRNIFSNLYLLSKECADDISLWLRGTNFQRQVGFIWLRKSKLNIPVNRYFNCLGPPLASKMLLF